MLARYRLNCSKTGKANMTLTQQTVVVGAGLAGITCARALVAAGRSVLVLDKGRGLGGRLATRHVTLGAEQVCFDHGAQYLHPSDPDFAQALVAAGARGWAGQDGAKLVGVPGISAVPRVMAQGLTIVQHAQVSALTQEQDGWHIAGLADPLVAQRVIVTIPAPQMAALLGADHPLSAAVAAVTMAPCLTLMVAFPPNSPRPFPHRLDTDHPLTWIAQNSSKVSDHTGIVTWVAQAGIAFSEMLLEESADVIIAHMLPLLCDVIGADPQTALYAQSHRWRFAQTMRALGQPFARTMDGSLYLGGDWCLGPRAQDAFTSGRAIAADILRQPHVD